MKNQTKSSSVKKHFFLPASTSRFSFFKTHPRSPIKRTWGNQTNSIYGHIFFTFLTSVLPKTNHPRQNYSSETNLSYILVGSNILPLRLLLLLLLLLLTTAPTPAYCLLQLEKDSRISPLKYSEKQPPWAEDVNRPPICIFLCETKNQHQIQYCAQGIIKIL